MTCPGREVVLDDLYWSESRLSLMSPKCELVIESLQRQGTHAAGRNDSELRHSLGGTRGRAFEEKAR